MSRADFNLLITLDVLLAEGSVARAARRLRLSPSAMSRALARLREATGDPLLVRAGRGLVPTPRAVELRDRVRRLVEEGDAVLRPAGRIDPARLARTFTIRASDGFAESFAPALIARAGIEAPGVRLRFIQKVDRESTALREGSVDLETAVVDRVIGPEIRAQSIFTDRIVGVVRSGHAFAGGRARDARKGSREGRARGRVTLARYATARHVLVSRSGVEEGPVARDLEAAGIARDVAVIVGGFAAALAIARATDLVATVPERHTATLRSGMHTFTLPFETRPIVISMLWHPRLDADPGHRWLRDCVREVCAGGHRAPGRADPVSSGAGRRG